MITLITGACGEGKTAYVVNSLVELFKQPENYWRPLFVHGVPELKLPHTQCKCADPLCEVCPEDPKEKSKIKLNIEEWFLFAPKGAIFLIDEAHFPFPLVMGKNEATLKMLTTHRKRGIDFFAITQTPVLLNDGFKKLANRHVHLISSWARRKLREWGSYRSDTNNKTDSVEKTYTLPKQIFSLYKSASLHTKIKRTKPPQIMLIAIMVLISAFLGFKLYASAKDKINPESNSTIETTPKLENNEKKPLNNKETQYDYMPLVKYVPESAPIYSGLPKPVDFPQLKGCLKNNRTGDCKCYTQQATLYEVSSDMCNRFISRLRFNPYYKKNEVLQRDTGSVANQIPSVIPNNSSSMNKPQS